MAAKDSAGVQEFPQAVFSVPFRADAEERVALAFNVKDGQQSVGQGVEDPYTKAVKYMEKHQIAEVLQVTIETVTPYRIPYRWPVAMPACSAKAQWLFSSCICYSNHLLASVPVCYSYSTYTLTLSCRA